MKKIFLSVILLAFLAGFISKVYVSNWESCTLTVSSDTNISSNVAFCRDVGDSTEVSGLIQWDGAGDSGSSFTVSISGKTINTAKLAGGANTANQTTSGLGISEWFDSGTAFKYVFVVFAGSNSVRFHENPGALAGTSFANGDALRVRFSVPTR